MRDLYHFYHVYCDEADKWTEVVPEHFNALYQSGLLAALSAPVKVGIIGNANQRLEVCDVIHEMCLPFTVVAVAQTGWEQETLRSLHSFSYQREGSAVLYAHTKGVAHPSDRQDDWRRRMTELLITDWKNCVLPLSMCEADIVGAYRLVNDGEAQGYAGDGADAVAAMLNDELGVQIPVGPRFPEVGEAIFAGNFWWATLDWIDSLKPPSCRSRYNAETWVGSTNSRGEEPRVKNVKLWTV